MERSKFNPIFVCPLCENQTNLSLGKSTVTCQKCGTVTKVELKHCDRCRDYYDMTYNFENTKGARIYGYLTIPCQTCAERRYTGPADLMLACLSCFTETTVHIEKYPLNGIVRSTCNNCNGAFTIVLNPSMKGYKYSVSYDSGGFSSMESAPEIPTGNFLFVCPGCKNKMDVDIVDSPDFLSGMIGLARAQSVGKPVMPQTVTCDCGLNTTVSLNRCRVCNEGFEMDYKYIITSKSRVGGPATTHEIPCSVCAEHLYNGPDTIHWICGSCHTMHTKKFKKYPPNGIFVNKCKKCGEPVTLFLTPQNKGYTLSYITHVTGNRYTRMDSDSLEYGMREYSR